MATKRAKKTVGRGPAKKARKKPALRSKTKRVSAIPKGYTTVTPYLIVRGAAKALEFYARAFGAKEKVRMPGPGGAVMHAEMKIGDAMVMLADENLEWGAKAPESLSGSPTHVMLYVRDADAFVARAVAAGATVEMPLENMFWGDRYGKIRDPFGHAWSVATHVEDVGGREMGRRMEIWMQQMARPRE
jgi:PhnB protein